MKKLTTLYFIFPLLLAAMTSCTEDISLAAAKLPDETPMNNTGGILRSERTLTNKIAINLSEDDETATDAVYYMLTKPAANAVTVTTMVDEKLVEDYNLANLTSLKTLPAANVQFESGGTLTIPAGQQASSKIKVTISTEGLELGATYLLALTVEQAPTGIQAQVKKQILYYGVSIREKITSVYPYDPYSPVDYPSMLPDLFSVFYVNTSVYQPAIADVYGILKESRIDFSQTLYTLGDIVNLRIVTVDYESATQRAQLNLSSDIIYVLENADKYIRRLQEHGRKVCLCIEGGGKGLGFCNMSDAQITDFANQVKDVITLYRLDGVNLWDRGSEYGKEGMPPMNTTSYPKLVKALREALPSKLLTLVDKGEPTEYFYDANLCGGIEVGKYIDYAWHGYVDEAEVVQIINPWEASQAYSKYTRKPIAGLTPDKYGSVNTLRYQLKVMENYENSTIRLVKWKMEKKKNNNIFVFGSDLTANEQSGYEGFNKHMIGLITTFMNDGWQWGINPGSGEEGIVPGDNNYLYQALDKKLDLGYKKYAKDW